jgi:hypothetical protein
VQLTVTISNTFGNGLCCFGEKNGHYKIYSGNPDPANLLVSGGEFEYYDVILLVLADDGTLHESNEYFASLGIGGDSTTEAASNSQGVTASQSTNNSNHLNDQTQKQPIEDSDADSTLVSADVTQSQPPDESSNVSNDVSKPDKQSQPVSSPSTTDVTQSSLAEESSIISNHDSNPETQIQIQPDGDNDTGVPLISTTDVTQSASPDESSFAPSDQESKTETPERPIAAQSDASVFDYTAQFDSEMEPTSNDEKKKNSMKSVMITVICVTIVIGLMLILIAQRRKSQNYTYYEGDDNSSIRSDDDIFENGDILESGNMDVEKSYRVKPVRRTSSTSSKSQPDQNHASRHVSKRGSFEDGDCQSVRSNDRSITSNRSARSVRSNHSANSNRSTRSVRSNHSANSNRSTKSNRSSRSENSYRSARSSRSARSNHSQRGNESQEADIPSHTEATFDDSSQGIDTIVQDAINDAISLFGGRSNDVRPGVNSILQRFDEEVENEGVLT